MIADKIQDNYQKILDPYQRLLIKNEKNIYKLKGKKIIIRLGTLFGFAPRLNASRGINKMIYASIIKNELVISNPEIKKSYTALSDLYNFINLIENNKIDDVEVYNISSFDTTIDIITKMISNKYDIPVVNKPDDKYIYSFHLSTELANNLGWKAKVDINNIYNEFIKNINNVELIKYTDVDTSTSEKSNLIFKSQSSFKLNNLFKKDKVESYISIVEVIVYKSLNICRVCDSYDLIPILNLNNHPPPNRLNDKLWKFINFKLILNCCLNCWHCQLNGVVNPIIMYNNYPYLSGTSVTMNKYFKTFVHNVTNYKNISKYFFNKYKILDIGCNDGSLLDKFKKEGYLTFGIDPTNNLINKNHNYYCGFFNDKAVKYFNLKFDIITAFNVFAHVDDIYDFLNNLDLISHENTLIFIQTSQCTMISNNEFDTIYHEHLSFFNLNSILEMCRRSNFYLADCEIVTVHGNSYLFTLKKKNTNSEDLVNSRVLKYYQKEVNLKYFTIDTYFNYNKNIDIWKNELMNLLLCNRNRIIGVGASAKGITILNFLKNDFKNCEINIECLIDENPLKIGKIITSINIKIEDFNYIKQKNKILFILFAWNYKKELIEKMKNLDVTNSLILNLFPLQKEYI